MLVFDRTTATKSKATTPRRRSKLINKLMEICFLKRLRQNFFILRESRRPLAEVVQLVSGGFHSTSNIDVKGDPAWCGVKKLFIPIRRVFQMKKFVFAVVCGFVFTATAFAAQVGSAQEIPVPEPLLAEPVKAAEAAEPEKTEPVVQKEFAPQVLALAQALGVSPEEAEKALLANGYSVEDPEKFIRESVNAEIAVETHYVHAWKDTPEGRAIIPIMASDSSKKPDFSSELFWMCGKRDATVLDINGFGDNSAVKIMQRLGVWKRLICAKVVTTVEYYQVKKKGPGTRRAAFVICISAPEGAWIINNGAASNCREAADPHAASYFNGKRDADWFQEEIDYGRDGDFCTYFAFYRAGKGEKIDCNTLLKKLISEGRFTTKVSYLPEIPIFAHPEDFK